ncbi:hypothetical protein [Phycicoccus avicenniae]|uniref:hypothetical protein n=1 Tax=Phycicoccus avicenniae TaxID=2828860 RepID=UPI003D28DB45
MARTTTRPSSDLDVRVDLRRDTQGKWRWHARVPGHLLADSGEGYSRRIDCLHGAMRVVGVHRVEWLTEQTGRESRIYDYGQASRGASVVEFYIWKRWVR